jgi:hypothetical protein
MNSSPPERFKARDLLTILGVLVLGAIGYTFDQRSGALAWVRWLTGPLQLIWLIAYLAVAAACLYGALRFREQGRWWGMALALYLVLMPAITMAGYALYVALTESDAP